MPTREPVIFKPRDYHTKRTLFLESVFKGHPWRTLDIGNLGDGPINVPVRQIVERNGGEYWGLDCNANLAKSLGFERQFIGDAHNLRGVIEDGFFDCVYYGEVIEHSWRPVDIIQECSRILKPGGYLILDTPNVYGLNNLLRYVIKGKDTLGLEDVNLSYQEAKDGFSSWRASGNVLSQPQHKILYSPAMLRQLLNMQGFDVSRSAFIGKPVSLFHRFVYALLPQCSEKIGIVAKKSDLESIFNVSIPTR